MGLQHLKCGFYQRCFDKIILCKIILKKYFFADDFFLKKSKIFLFFSSILRFKNLFINFLRQI